MIVSSSVTLAVGDTKMPAYIARPGDDGAYPAVIVLEGVYGFDDELKRVTDLLASFGYVALAINYFHRTSPDLSLPFTAEGRAAGESAAAAVKKADACADVGAARDWLNEQPFVETGHIGTWGFGFGGTIAFVTATLAGINAAVVFYGQSITSLMPSGEAAPIQDAKDIRAPLLLVFGGRDEMIAERDIETITSTLGANNKRFDQQIYPNVGHSFFRVVGGGSNSMREAADAWDRTQAFFKKYLR
jgi:carboxymethylenebutenolidase